MADEKLPNDILRHQSGVNPQGEPFVQLIRGETIIGQFSVSDARDHASAMLIAAEAAETDAFVFQWVIDRLQGDPRMATEVLTDFRRYREQATGKREGPTSPRDWVMPPPKTPTPSPAK